MNRIVRLWRAWVRLMSRRERGDAMALFRIFVGLATLFSLVPMVAGGIDKIIWVDKAFGGYRALGDGPYLVRWLGGPTDHVIRGIVISTIASTIAVVVGLGGRIPAFIALQGYIALHRIDYNASGSSDLLVTNALWLLVLSRSTATLSLDCRIQNGRFFSNEEISAFPRYLAIFQLIAMYGATGSQKISVYWFPAGSFAALYYILQQPTWQRFSMEWAAKFYPLTQISTVVTWLWEVTTPLLLLVYYYRNTKDRPGRLRRWFGRFDLRKPWAVVGLSLHVMIWATMDVGHFSHISMAYYFCIWQPEEIRAAWGKVRSIWERRVLRHGLAPQAPEPSSGEGDVEPVLPDKPSDVIAS